MIEATVMKAVSEAAKEITEVAKGAVSEVGNLPDKLGRTSEIQGLPDKIGPTQKWKILEQERCLTDVDSGSRPLVTNAEKGNYGEMKTDQDLRKKGYERISENMVTDIAQEGRQGIDGVYYDPKGKPKYLIVDAKYGTAQLGDTMDGKQMSQAWIDKRLDASVGKETADKIRMEQLTNPDNVGNFVAHADENGKVTYDRLDSKANVIEKGVNIGA